MKKDWIGMRSFAWRIVAVALLATLVVAPVGRPVGQDGPSLLRGLPLGNDSRLRLLVADNPPFVLDVDRNRVVPLDGVRPSGKGTVSVVGVGGQGGIVLDQRAPGCDFRAACVFSVTADGRRAVPLGRARNVAPATGSRSVWVQRNVRQGSCAIQEVGLDGRSRTNRRPFPCSHGLDPGGSLGLIVRRNGDRVIDPATGRTALRGFGIVAAGQGKALVSCPGAECGVLDLRTGTRVRVPWSDPLGGAHDPAFDSQGRYAAVSFGIPNWRDGFLTRQTLDVWVVDLVTSELTQVPGMPIFVSLKFTSIEWAADGRLVILGEVGVRSFVATWSPGERGLRVKSVKLPRRTGGSDAFAVLR